MNQKQKVIILIFLIFLLCEFSYSQRYKGNDLVKDMKEYEKHERGEEYSRLSVGEFFGYVIGITSAYDEVFFSTPSDSTNGQLCAVVEKYLNENPEKWNESALNLVTDALKKAFPKKK